MDRDLRLLGWLRLRQLRGSAAYWLGTVGYDIDDHSLVNRSYGVYLVIILGGWVVLMWSFYAYHAATIGTRLTPALHQQLLAWLPSGVLLGLVIVLMRTLRSSPLKLTTPDSAYIAGSPLRSAAVALVGFGRSLVPVALIVVAAITIIGNGLVQLAGPTAIAGIDGRTALVGLLLGWLLWSVAWVLGLTRLAIPRLYNAPLLWLAPLLLLLPLPVVTDVLRWPGDVLVAAILNEGWLWQAGVLLLLNGLAAAALVMIGRRVDLTDVNDESVIYAQIKALGLMTLVDPSVAQRVRRQARQAQRKPWPPLPRAPGYGALVARALIGFVRQPVVLLFNIALGVAIIQIGAWLILMQSGIVALLSWLFVVLVVPPRGLLAVFKLDAEEPFLRQLLPYNNLLLLLADTAFPLGILAVSSVVVWTLLDVALLSAIFGSLLALLLGLLLVLCLGAPFTRARMMSFQPSYTALALGSMGSILLISLLTVSPIAPTIIAALLVGLLGWWVATERED